MYDEAKEISQSTVSDEKFPFALQYDSKQKELLLSLLQMVGAIVEDDDEEGHMLATMMNMTQLAFIKLLDCVERVKNDEDINPFLAEEAVRLTPLQQGQQEDEAFVEQIDMVMAENNADVLVTEANLINNKEEAIVSGVESTDEVAVASVTTSARSPCSSCSCILVTRETKKKH